jgi:ATP-dependent exoDNAse (exonuclease V) beta subunit
LPPFEWVAELAREIGVIAHRYLAWVARDGLGVWTDERIANLDSRVDAELAAAGFEASERQAAIAKVQAAIRCTIDDPKGRWLFDPAHRDARSEWALAGLDDGAIEHVVIDRTFVAGDTRWIVDFKTSTHEGGDVLAFLASERQRYSDQLARYGRMVRALGETKPIRLALYYPLIEQGFLDWAFEG